MRRYLRPCMALALEYVESVADAEDLVQEAFLRSLEHLDRYDSSRPWAPWLFTILRNAARNETERRRTWSAVSLEEEEFPDRPGHLAPPLEEWEMRDAITAGLEELSDRQRACFRLRDLEGFTGPEVARMLGMEPATVRVHLHRARHALRRVLGPLLDTRSPHEPQHEE